MNLPKLSLTNRKFTFSIAIVVLLSVFFVGYYFYFIPMNQADLHKDGFLILGNIRSNLEDRNADLQQLFTTYYAGSEPGAPVTAGSVQRLMHSNRSAGTAVQLKATGKPKADSLPAIPVRRGDTGVYLTRIENSHLIYLPQNAGSDSIAIMLPADSLLAPILQPQRTEFFRSYLVISGNRIIYADPGVGIASGTIADTLLLNKKESLFSGIKDISFENEDYKMYHVPFRLHQTDVILCGLVRAGAYNQKLNSVPVSFIYPIAIIFLLLVIFLPLLKFYIMGRDEQVKFLDLSLGAVSFFVGMTLFTLIVIQIMLLTAAEIRARDHLHGLSAQINSAFISELKDAYDQLDGLDTFMARSQEAAAAALIRGKKEMDVSAVIRRYLDSAARPNQGYYNFDRASWIDSAGNQFLKGQLSPVPPLFTNVRKRQYFKVFEQGRPFLMPDRPYQQFGLEPVNTWTNGEFSIILSKHSQLPEAVITTMSAKMFSVIHTVLPPGYGFCIIDEEGDVLLHSDMNRNLQENLLDKTGGHRRLREAIVGRQDTYLPDIRFYGRTNALHIRPVGRTPMFLVTYYDKGYIIPINMRILTFSLLFCLLSYVSLSLIWFLFFRKPYYSYPMLYAPMTYLKWAIPKKRAAAFYAHGIVFLTTYSILLLLSIFLSSGYNFGNFVLLLALFTPFNIICGLYIISRLADDGVFRTPEECRVRADKVFTVIVLHLVISIGAYYGVKHMGYPVEPSFLYMQCFQNLLLWLYYFFPSRILSKTTFPVRNYLNRYATFGTLIIIALAVLPATLYTFYAHNQELIQSVKKEQLYLARSVQEREGVIRDFLVHQQLNPPQAVRLYEQLQYHTGIYPINQDTVRLDSSKFPSRQSYENFYFTVANGIGNNYYDPLLFPALKDTSDNGEWQWSGEGDHVYFRYTLGPGVQTGDSHRKTETYLKISSRLPERYKIIGFELRGIVLYLAIGGMIAGLFILFRSLTKRIFLIKYRIAIVSHQPKPSIETYFIRYLMQTPDADQMLKDEVSRHKEEYDFYIPGATAEETFRQERQMLDTLERFRGFYDFIWDNSTEKEKYLLLDLARDGMVNFRNAAELYNLIEKSIIILHEEEVKLFSASFRAYILARQDSPEMYSLREQYQKNSTWQAFRVPVLIVLAGIAVFIFFTQEQTFQRILALVAGVSSMSSLVLKLFVDSNLKAAAAKAGG